MILAQMASQLRRMKLEGVVQGLAQPLIDRMYFSERALDAAAQRLEEFAYTDREGATEDAST